MYSTQCTHELSHAACAVHYYPSVCIPQFVKNLLPAIAPPVLVPSLYIRYLIRGYTKYDMEPAYLDSIATSI